MSEYVCLCVRACVRVCVLVCMCVSVCFVLSVVFMFNSLLWVQTRSVTNAHWTQHFQPAGLVSYTPLTEHQLKPQPVNSQAESHALSFIEVEIRFPPKR